MSDIDTVRELLKRIAERPDLPNPDRDADWKNCQKWSSHDAKEALTALQSIEEENKRLREATEWRDIASAPVSGHAFVWIEYKDRSGPGFWKEAFCWKGEWEIRGFDKWDYEHKEITHWQSKQRLYTPPQSQEKTDDE